MDPHLLHMVVRRRVVVVALLVVLLLEREQLHSINGRVRTIYTDKWRGEDLTRELLADESGLRLYEFTRFDRESFAELLRLVGPAIPLSRRSTAMSREQKLVCSFTT